MKILLARGKDVDLFGQTPSRQQNPQDHPEFGNALFYRSQDVLADLEQPENGDNIVLPQLSLILRNQLEKYRAVKHPTNSLSYSCFWNVIVGVGVAQLGDVNLKGHIQVDDVFQDGCLSAIWELYGNDARLQVFIDLAGDGSEDKSNCKISTAEMELSSDLNGMTFCQDVKMTFPAAHFGNWKTSKGLQAEVKLILAVEDEIFRGKTMPPITSVVSCANRRMLEEGTLSDVTLVASDGANIKAHRVFLAAESPVFLTMFPTDMQESRECIVEISDMSEKSIRNMLTHLYCKEMKLEDMYKEVAFELFHASHKYEIRSLQGIMRRFILTMPTGWYDLDTCVQLFAYARNLTPPDEELEAKAMQELKMFKYSLLDSTALQDLFRNEPKTGLEMLKYAWDV